MKSHIFGALKVPEVKIFPVNVNIIRQPPAMAHFRWCAQLAFKIYVNGHVYSNGTEFGNSAIDEKKQNKSNSNRTFEAAYNRK